MLTKRPTQEIIHNSDDSDDELVETKIGDVPLVWYNNENHIGYSTEGLKVPKKLEMSQIDKLLASEQNPDFWRTIYDEMNQKVVKLTPQQIQLLRRIKNKAYIDDAIKNTDYNYELEPNPFPMKDTPVIKRRFMPSRHERLKINKIVYAMKMGWFKPPPPIVKRNPIKEFFDTAYDTWASVKDNVDKRLPTLAPPKLNMPTHEDSFNPPPEYMENPKPAPKNLRGLQNDGQLLKQNFERLMSLYLAPRVMKKKIHMRPEDLVEDLPDLQEMRPYPAKVAINIDTKSENLKSLSFSSNDVYFAVADDFGNVRVYHTMTSRMVYNIKVKTENMISCEFTPSGCLMIVCEEFVDIYSLKLTASHHEKCIQRFSAIYENHKGAQNDDENPSATFDFPHFENKDDRKSYMAHLMRINLKKNRIASASLHRKEDYLCIVTKKQDDSRNLEVIHITHCRHTKISIRAKSKIQKVLFHNVKPFLFIMTVSHVFVFDLQKQSVKKKLVSGCKFLSNMALHRTGDHLIVCSYDRQVLWFDLDSNEFPFKKMKIHNLAVRGVTFSPNMNLMASCSDDGKVIVQYAKVDEEGFAYPSIVPLKALFGHKKSKLGLNVLDTKFMNNKYWLASSGADGKVLIWA